MRGEVAGFEQAIRGSSESRYDNQRFSTCSLGNNGTGTINSGGIFDGRTAKFHHNHRLGRLS
jgi:hypothetical protein